jgi:hypothetical protein
MSEHYLHDRVLCRQSVFGLAFQRLISAVPVLPDYNYALPDERLSPRLHGMERTELNRSLINKDTTPTPNERTNKRLVFL